MSYGLFYDAAPAAEIKVNSGAQEIKSVPYHFPYHIPIPLKINQKKLPYTGIIPVKSQTL